MSTQTSWVQIVNLLSQLVVFESYNFREFLKKLIILLTKLISVDSCLIYFYDKHTKELILVGSKKSHTELMGKITMKKGEGITGWVVVHKKTVRLTKKAYEDERFKTFENLPEDTYEAFLSVPILDKEGVVGVINLQNKKPYAFSSEQVKTVEAIVKIVASAFEKIVLDRKVDDLEQKLEERKTVERAKGVLMKKNKMTEREAYQMMQREAMKKRKTMKEIAEAVLLIYE
ncbi:MAG: hypothetical protein RI947_1608 [Candidatus Parcubacteria bacterium]|jgi:uroporphyrinogen-III synthase